MSLVSVTLTGAMVIRIAESVEPVGGFGRKPPTGDGYLAGEFPDGITRVEGVPGPATIRVLYRPASRSLGDGVLMAEVQSGHDGTWRVDGLSTAHRFDVVCRHDGYNDMILSNVAPATD